MPTLMTCLGESLIDFFPITERGETVGFRMAPAGSLLNVAVALARLGQPTAFAGKVSTDFFGRTLRSYAEREGIDTRFLRNDPASSTLAFVTIEHDEPSFSFFGEQAADTRVTANDFSEAFFAETGVLHIGSISLLRGSTPDAVLYAVQQLRGKALISLDPNIRPGLVQDAEGYRARLTQLFGLVDLVKISAVDLEWLLPNLSVEEGAAQILSFGPALVVVTRGSQGALALRSGETQPRIVQVPGFRVALVDTVGAGDTFNAGLLNALAEQQALSGEAIRQLTDAQIAEVLRQAAAAAAVNCSRPGADPPTRAEVAQFLAEA